MISKPHATVPDPACAASARAAEIRPRTNDRRHRLQVEHTGHSQRSLRIHACAQPGAQQSQRSKTGAAQQHTPQRTSSRRRYRAALAARAGRTRPAPITKAMPQAPVRHEPVSGHPISGSLMMRPAKPPGRRARGRERRCRKGRARRRPGSTIDRRPPAMERGPLTATGTVMPPPISTGAKWPTSPTPRPRRGWPPTEITAQIAAGTTSLKVSSRKQVSPRRRRR